MALTLLPYEVGNTHVTVEWYPTSLHTRFHVEMEEDGAYRTLSDTVKGGALKKKNLTPGKEYVFRVRGEQGGWGDWSSPCCVRTLTDPPPAAPTLGGVTGQDDGKFAVLLEWPAEGEGVTTVQMRRGGTPEWVTLSTTLKGTSVRKKNLEKGVYLFRYRVGGGPWSLVSSEVGVEGVAPSLRTLLGDTLLRGLGTPVPVDTLTGKVLCLYFSASWCPPCQKQTQMMIPSYRTFSDLPVEVVFISLDKSTNAFFDYYNKMPWLALAFDAPQREQARVTYKVTGIPRLMVFSRTTQLITENAAGVPLTRETVEQWVHHP